MNRVYHKSIIIFSVICNTVFPGVFRLLHRLSLVNSLILWSLKQILTLYPKTGCDFCRDQWPLRGEPRRPTDLAALGPRACPGHPPQSEVHGYLCIWTDQGPQRRLARRGAPDQGADAPRRRRGLAVHPPRPPSRLHHLGAIPAESTTPLRPLHLRSSRATRGGSRRGGTVARPRPVRAVWVADDDPLHGRRQDSLVRMQSPSLESRREDLSIAPRRPHR